MIQTTVENDNKPELVIFSVHQADKTQSQNEHNHEYALKHLNSLNIAFKEVEGVYTYDNGKRASEASILVTLDEEGNHENVVNALCLTFNQESYLYSDTDRNSYLMKPQQGVTDSCLIASLGKLKSVHRFDAVRKEAYTYCSQLNRYFVCEKG